VKRRYTPAETSEHQTWRFHNQTGLFLRERQQRAYHIWQPWRRDARPWNTEWKGHPQIQNHTRTGSVWENGCYRM